MSRRWMVAVAMAVSMAVMLPLMAQDVELRPDHPREYVVREGDTLWDIAGRFLTRPWQWPAIWQANPQIENPHLIFPGDRLSLVYIDGQPRLVRDDGIRRLSPAVRRSDSAGPVAAVPLSAVQSFLHEARIVGRDELAGLPYVVLSEDGRSVAAEPHRAFVRGLEGRRAGDQVVIARLSSQIEEVEVDGRTTVKLNEMRGNRGAVPVDRRPVPVGQSLNPFAREGKVVGYQLLEVARGEVLALGDPATLEILDAEFEVRPGDYILPIDPYLYDLTFFPRPPARPIPEGASVIGIQGGDNAIAHYQIATIDLGAADGIEPGHTFSIFHANREVRDRFVNGLRGRPAPDGVVGERVQLPPQFIGHLMVFRSFENLSVALVMDGKRGVRVGDRIDHPDRRL
ncbi:MAG: LysM domain-containing protein [Wenzhouxiangellaceae bacterium]|nr:LysM domain-containing protein [Wenzhouxiangellaceae bacterium]